MGNISAWIAFIIWMVSAFLVWRLYHKIFRVHYFNLGQALAKEAFFSLLIGGIIAGIIVKILRIG